MVRSSQIPVVSTLVEVDVTNLVKFREANKEAFEKQNGVKLTYTPFFIKAIAETLLEFPYVNSAVGDNYEVTLNRTVHMGVAVSLGEDGTGGLIVPVIRDCHTKTLVQITKDLTNIAKRARSNALEPADVQGATFTMTNPGSYGATLGTPMISAPQAGIIGAYGIVKRPVVIDDMIAVRSMMNVVLTYDHRVVDGMTAGLFLQLLKKKLEGFDFYK
jgi:pyruvate/2-oxoglutarate dehydrogenase complex dihydrolipoamide acyltransferase (E2) component